MAPPDKLRIPYESEAWERFHHIGKLKDGTQFMAFVTGAFPGKDRYPDSVGVNAKRWLAVIHLFDSEGNYLRSEVQHGGFDKIDGRLIAGEKAEIALEQMLMQIDGEPGDIYVKPFSVEIDGVFYELVYESESDEEEGPEYEWMMLYPNDIMFHPPWESGEYST